MLLGQTGAAQLALLYRTRCRTPHTGELTQRIKGLLEGR
jgi:hypothetical protein